MKLKPFVKWIGGKGRISEKIIADFDKDSKNGNNFSETMDCYVEPFLGGGAILFKLQPKNAIISDINTNLINIYLIIRDNINKLFEILENISKEYLLKNDRERKKYYYLKRDEYNNIKYYDEKIDEKKIDERIKCASLFLFLNKTGYNGMYRENKKGKYNIPFGKYKNPTICNNELLKDISYYLNNNKIEILCQSYKDTLKYINEKYEIDKNVLIYLDPPYYPSKNSNFTEYTKYSFHIKEQKELFKIYSNQKFSIFLSNSNCDEINVLYKEYDIFLIDVLRSISAKKSSRGVKQELLIYKKKNEVKISKIILYEKEIENKMNALKI